MVSYRSSHLHGARQLRSPPMYQFASVKSSAKTMMAWASTESEEQRGCRVGQDQRDAQMLTLDAECDNPLQNHVDCDVGHVCCNRATGEVPKGPPVWLHGHHVAPSRRKVERIRAHTRTDVHDVLSLAGFVQRAPPDHVQIACLAP
eukprot:1264825-Prymnesium_polylepis.1